jgi:hypothetical protein
MKQCSQKCRICDEFEAHIHQENDASVLMSIRRSLMKQERKKKVTPSEWIADFLVSKVLTMKFFFLCNIIAFIPLVAPQTMTVLQFISSSWLQLVMLPLLGVVANRQEEVNARRAEREYRMLLVNDRLDELRDRGKP